MTTVESVRRWTACAAALMLTGALSACTLTIPTDPDGTLSAVSGGTLRVGAGEEPGLIEIDGRTATGPLPDLVTSFAERIDADTEWVIAGEQTLVTMLEEGELDLAIGAFQGDTPWSDRAGVTRAYSDLPGTGGREVVMLVPLGENAFLSQLELFLDEEAER